MSRDHVSGLLLVLTINSIFPWMCSSSAIPCPTVCSCFLDTRGRKVVSCNQGGLTAIPFKEMESRIELINVSAPEYNLNTLTMDPTIQDFKFLEEIHITSSNIPELGVHLFWNLKKLSVLNLSQNNITQPLDASFRGLSNLKELYLDDNRIHSLPSGTFRYLLSLKILSLQRNRIREMMPRMFEELGKLQVLKLSGNYLRELNPESFKDVLKDLRVLECQGCSLHKINTQVYGYLPHLTHLDLGYNELEMLSTQDFSNLTNLKYIGLDGNKISALTADVFIHARGLKKINLTRNRISRINPGAFNNLNNLTELDLCYNKLENVDVTILEPIAENLQKLLLSGNHISMTNLRSLMTSVPQLRNLQLAEAGIYDIPVHVFPETLSVLNLSGNFLTALTSDAIPATLLDLDLSKNRFGGLSDGFLQRVEYIIRLNLDNNPWSCDLCHIVPMLERANVSSILRDVKCKYPYRLEGMLLGELRSSDLNWCSTPEFSGDVNYFLTGNEDGKVGITAATVAILLLLLAGAVGLIVICHGKMHAAIYYTNEEKRTAETEAIFDNQSALFGDEKELSFKFPVDYPQKKIAIATIDEELKKEPIMNEA
ncbi:hypothetical protein RI129_004971 [Pyrocoelia pectoralis]|uniref:Uncharacterized protein n=1 Tax=Pyrocoelia pectoralis TaxID=417401 RepID=A0AAN7ZL23_9COLE